MALAECPCRDTWPVSGPSRGADGRLFGRTDGRIRGRSIERTAGFFGKKQSGAHACVCHARRRLTNKAATGPQGEKDGS